MNKTKKPTVTKDIDHKSTFARNRELEDQLKRALADYQNLERRVEEERRILGQLSSAILIEKFLPVLDNLENAQSHLKDQGLEIVLKQFKDILREENVEEVETEGSQFDPNWHEATEVVEGPNEGMVVKVIRKGYKLNGKVLRPAQVVVSRKSAEESVSQKQNLMGLEGGSKDA